MSPVNHRQSGLPGAVAQVDRHCGTKEPCARRALNCDILGLWHTRHGAHRICDIVEPCGISTMSQKVRTPFDYGWMTEVSMTPCSWAKCVPPGHIVTTDRVVSDRGNGQNDWKNFSAERWYRRQVDERLVRIRLYVVCPEPVSYTHLTLPTTAEV